MRAYQRYRYGWSDMVTIDDGPSTMASGCHPSSIVHSPWFTVSRQLWVKGIRGLSNG